MQLAGIRKAQLAGGRQIALELLDLCVWSAGEEGKGKSGQALVTQVAHETLSECCSRNAALGMSAVHLIGQPAATPTFDQQLVSHHERLGRRFVLARTVLVLEVL